MNAFVCIGSAFRDCADRACAFACATVDAGVGVDLELGFSLRDRFYRTCACAGAAADAFRTDNSCHGMYLLVNT